MFQYYTKAAKWLYLKWSKILIDYEVEDLIQESYFVYDKLLKKYGEVKISNFMTSTSNHFKDLLKLKKHKMKFVNVDRLAITVESFSNSYTFSTIDKLIRNEYVELLIKDLNEKESGAANIIEVVYKKQIKPPYKLTLQDVKKCLNQKDAEFQRNLRIIRKITNVKEA